MKTILLVDDEAGIAESLKMVLGQDYRLLWAATGEEALKRFYRNPPHLILLDILLPGSDGLTLLKQFREIEPSLPIIMLTGTRMVKTAVEAMKMGATDYVNKPFNIDELRLTIDNAIASYNLGREVLYLRSEVSQKYRPDNLVGKSRIMREVFLKIEQVANAKTTVLITGESGTGKEMVARALHYNSVRRDRPFVAINCASIPESLIESELFGYEKGAFTDAAGRKLGQFEAANGGTLFLDEIAELSPATQAKLLRVLQSKEFTRIGGTRIVQVDVRLIAATNKNLEEALRRKTFREDLYYRINVFSIHLPPLRERMEDVPLLLNDFLDKKSKENNLKTKSLNKEAQAYLMRYDWPGNIRELENVIEQAVTLSTHQVIGVNDLPMQLRTRRKTNTFKEEALGGRLSLVDAVKSFEREIIESALKEADYIQTKTARLLGITRRILKYKMDMLGITTNSNPETSSSAKSSSDRLKMG
ncbi:MAG: sigma-54-dependent Fis family transcriptional regulator [Nitrospirae bacterium]|nr:sigma-54-dependent Fis family transcriptional regulator [Nitrospirota bacterium]